MSHVAYLRHVKEPESVCAEVADFGRNYRPFLAQVVPPFTTMAVQVGTTKGQGLYNKPSAAVHPGALAAGTLPHTYGSPHNVSYGI